MFPTTIARGRSAFQADVPVIPCGREALRAVDLFPTSCCESACEGNAGSTFRATCMASVPRRGVWADARKLPGAVKQP